jgi:hypothetical protein
MIAYEKRILLESALTKNSGKHSSDPVNNLCVEPATLWSRRANISSEDTGFAMK